jgi:hypothetical protein
MSSETLPLITLQEALNAATLSIPEAGWAFYKLGRHGAYEAARRGDIPTMDVGGKKRVPVAPIAQKLGLPFTAGRGEQ